MSEIFMVMMCRDEGVILELYTITINSFESIVQWNGEIRDFYHKEFMPAEFAFVL